MTEKASYLVLGADTPWVRGLCEALTDQGCRVKGLHFLDLWKFHLGLKRRSDNLTTCDDRFIPVPPSYGTRLQWLTRGYLTALITQHFNALATEKPNNTWLVVTNPVAEFCTHGIPDDRLIYWNYDDYALYDPGRAEQISSWEEGLVRRSRVVLCASRIQLIRFLAKYPGQASKCVHFPNAVRAAWLTPVEGRRVEANTVGYIGNMGDRVDWRFVHETASILPDVRFVFVGRLDEKIKPKKMLEWHALRDKVFCLKNVESLGHVPYEKLAHFYQSFAVNWMPYDTTKPFNIASCPTKIFDALAAGRPFLSTDLPECRMYSEYIRIVTCPSEAREAILSSLLNWNFALEARQIGFAKRNDWHARATLLDQLLLS